MPNPFDGLRISLPPRNSILTVPGYPNICKTEETCGFSAGEFTKENDGTISFEKTTKYFCTAEDFDAFVAKRTADADQAIAAKAAAEAKLELVNDL